MCRAGEELKRGNGPWKFRILEFQESLGHYDVINGGQKKNYFFRPDVTFEVDAQWLLNRCKSYGSRLPPFRVRYCPQRLREGVQNVVKIWPAPFCVLTQFCAGQMTSGCQKST